MVSIYSHLLPTKLQQEYQWQNSQVTYWLEPYRAVLAHVLPDNPAGANRAPSTVSS